MNLSICISTQTDLDTIIPVPRADDGFLPYFPRVEIVAVVAVIVVMIVVLVATAMVVVSLTSARESLIR